MGTSAAFDNPATFSFRINTLQNTVGDLLSPATPLVVLNKCVQFGQNWTIHDDQKASEALEIQSFPESKFKPSYLSRRTAYNWKTISPPTMRQKAPETLEIQGFPKIKTFIFLEKYEQFWHKISFWRATKNCQNNQIWVILTEFRKTHAEMPK